MESELAKQIKKLSIPERILLVEEIWDDIARENEELELTPGQKEELEKRLQSYYENPSMGRTWKEIRADFVNH